MAEDETAVATKGDEGADLVTRRREQIRRAALKIISEKGYQAFGIADVAAELGIGHGTFYRYFKNKQDVAVAALDELISRVTQVVIDIPARDIDTLEQYRERNERIGNALFDLMEEDPYLARWISYEVLGLPAEVTDRIQDAFELFADYTEEYVKNGVAKGFLRADVHTRQAAISINAMLFEAAKHVSRKPPPYDESSRKTWTDTINGMLLDGLGA